MKSPVISCLALCALLWTSGCAALVRYNSPSHEGVPAGHHVTVRSLGFLWGLVPPQPISLDQCGPGGIKRMKVKIGLIDWIINYATVGIVVSTKVKIICAAGPVAGG